MNILIYNKTIFLDFDFYKQFIYNNYILYLIICETNNNSEFIFKWEVQEFNYYILIFNVKQVKRILFSEKNIFSINKNFFFIAKIIK